MTCLHMTTTWWHQNVNTIWFACPFHKTSMMPLLERLASAMFLSTASKLITLHMLFALISLRYRSLHDAPFIWDEMTNCSCRKASTPRSAERLNIISPSVGWAGLHGKLNLPPAAPSQRLLHQDDFSVRRKCAVSSPRRPTKPVRSPRRWIRGPKPK